jgi:hypothetical protein
LSDGGAMKLVCRRQVLGHFVGVLSANVFAQNSEKLFRSAALVALQMSNQNEFPFRRAPGEAQISQGIAVFGQTIDLGQNGNACAHRDKRF